MSYGSIVFDVKFFHLMAMCHLLLWDSWSPLCMHSCASQIFGKRQHPWLNSRAVTGLLILPHICNYSQGSPSIAGSLRLQGMSIQTNESISHWRFLSPCCQEPFFLLLLLLLLKNILFLGLKRLYFHHHDFNRGFKMGMFGFLKF